MIRWAPELLGREQKESESGSTARHAEGSTACVLVWFSLLICCRILGEYLPPVALDALFVGGAES